MSLLGIHVLLPSDQVQITQILKGWDHFSSEAIDAAMEFCEEAACHPFQQYYGYCAKVDRVVVGFVVFGLAPLTDRCWDLYWIGVAPRFSRQGVGEALVRYMEHIIIGQHGRQVYIDTSSLSDFIPACRFYQKMGFRNIACLKDYYRQGDDKLIYVKDLSG
ncbi:MAG: GNAT family N-acetyltransferase [Proteobacteria bacterium]|nr:GNAT family N-acetyltransferase [Desulfobulbaceae bacterium]MBU4151409.1 GNAT family N-acetyltransferase [Pseudomonadota bacterium]